MTDPDWLLVSDAHPPWRLSSRAPQHWLLTGADGAEIGHVNPDSILPEYVDATGGDMALAAMAAWYRNLPKAQEKRSAGVTAVFVDNPGEG